MLIEQRNVGLELRVRPGYNHLPVVPTALASPDKPLSLPPGSNL
jgi:hypothetical protein